jgi:hypothetical protein
MNQLQVQKLWMQVDSRISVVCLQYYINILDPEQTIYRHTHEFESHAGVCLGQ